MSEEDGKTALLIDIEQLRSIVRRALRRRKEALTYALARTLHALHENENRAAAGWIAIESLSALRAQVGGRLEQLKSRWEASGFPVRMRKGDREGKAELRPEAWQDFVRWLDLRGFEARLPLEEGPVLFEIRRREG